MSHSDLPREPDPPPLAALDEANLKLRSATERLRQLNEELKEMAADFGSTGTESPLPGSREP